MKIKRYYVQNTLTDKTKGFSSLKKAVEYCITEKNTALLIHIGGYNLDYYKIGDDFLSLYSRCKEYLNSLVK